MVASNFDDDGIALVSSEGAGTFLLKAHSAPLDFAVGSIDEQQTCGTDVIWIERPVPGVGGPWLLWAEIGEEPAPVVHELPFPIPGADGGVFERRAAAQLWPVLLSATAGGRLYLARLFYPAAAGGHVDVTDLGLASESPRISVELDDRIVGGFDRVAELGANGSTSVVMAHYDSLNESVLPSIDYQGTWPDFVISANHGEWVAGEGGREQLALLDQDGIVSIWDFLHDPAEVEPTYFGIMPTGTQEIATFDFEVSNQCVAPYCGVVGLDPDGNAVFIAGNGAASGLRPQSFDIGPSCSTCSLDQGELFGPEWFGLDDTAVKVHVAAAAP